ncbi:MAG: HEPN domain-containing protein [Candidatus Brockarchaeota archaeon]|nr:HEPN domain-containing protein [Candidatus Brockarchaeota archaeon]
MSSTRDRAKEAIRSAEREFRNAAECLREEDYAGALKYLQECAEYAVKAVLIAYGLDYPKAHAVGRFLYEIPKDKYPKWFLERLDAVAEITDDLARGRPRFRYPYEYPPQEYENVARESFPKVRKSLEDCRRLVTEFFG